MVAAAVALNVTIVGVPRALHARGGARISCEAHASLALTPRDLDILKTIECFRFLTSEHIQRLTEAAKASCAACSSSSTLLDASSYRVPRNSFQEVATIVSVDACP
jgi:hypothetical protein